MGSILININVYIGKLIHTFFFIYSSLYPCCGFQIRRHERDEDQQRLLSELFVCLQHPWNDFGFSRLWFGGYSHSKEQSTSDL